MQNSFITQIAEEYGTPFYLLDLDKFTNNYKELENSFKRVYDDFRIAYSFKANYTPAICKQVCFLGGYAEVVSGMEYQMAKKFGFHADRIIVNGPGKICGLYEMLIDGALLMLDNKEELDLVLSLTKKLDKRANIGFRMNFEIGSGKNSRFGFDAQADGIFSNIEKARNSDRVIIKGLHYHLGGARTLEAWKNRAEKMIVLSNKLLYPEERCIIDLGSGMFGHLDPELAEQFSVRIPSFIEYANDVAGSFNEYFGQAKNRPQLVVEPGATLVADTTSYITKVVAIKKIRGRNIAIVDGSVHQLGEMGRKKKLPLTIISQNQSKQSEKKVINTEITGYTCLEDDVLHPQCCEPLSVGDLVIIGNAGAYSNVLKPPFIQPGCKIVMCDSIKGVTLCKREETVEDILASYIV